MTTCVAADRRRSDRAGKGVWKGWEARGCGVQVEEGWRGVLVKRCMINKARDSRETRAESYIRIGYNSRPPAGFVVRCLWSSWQRIPSICQSLKNLAAPQPPSCVPAACERREGKLTQLATHSYKQSYHPHPSLFCFPSEHSRS